MPHRKDCILTALGSGDVAGLLLSYYQTNGATSNDLQDAEREFLVAQGADEESNQDMWNSLLKTLGYSGSLSDMLNAFWCIGGGVIGTEDFMLLESGDFFLLESGDKLIKE
jgi:hypothetical protein